MIRQFEKIEQHLFASQGYLNEFGDLKTPEQLSEHKILSMAEEHTEQFLILQNEQQQQKKIRINPTVMGSDLNMLAQLAASGCGITLLPDNVVQQYIERANWFGYFQTGKRHMEFSIWFILPSWSVTSCKSI